MDGATCTAVLSHHDCILEAAQNGAQQAGLVEPAAYGSAAACWPPRLAGEHMLSSVEPACIVAFATWSMLLRAEVRCTQRASRSAAEQHQVSKC